MMRDAFLWLIIYCAAGGTVGVFVDRLARNWRSVPDGADPAIGFFAGVIWPLPLLIGLGWLCWRLGKSISVLFADWTVYDTLDVLNFAFLQWLFVRLTRRLVYDTETRPTRPPWHEWRLQRWIWPLTGWWSNERRIGR